MVKMRIVDDISDEINIQNLHLNSFSQKKYIYITKGHAELENYAVEL
jgi:hypothetical protein